MATPKKIVIIATLDTKGEETRFVKELIEKRGHVPITIDCGIRGTPYFQPSISRQAVAEAAGMTLDEIITKLDKNNAIRAMTLGTKEIALRLYREGQLDGVIALGGVQGTMIGTAVMQALPFGVPKVMVSTVANGQTTFGPFTGTKDITMIHSVADILGLNFVTRQVLAEGVGAITGMVEMEISHVAPRPAVGMTTAGITTACAMRVREVMESWGYEVISFHCNGIGAKAMEELADAEGWLEFWISPPTMSSIRFLGGSFLQALIEWRPLAAADYHRWSFPEGPISSFLAALNRFRQRCWNGST